MATAVGGGDHPEADLGAACDALGDEEVSALVGVPVTAATTRHYPAARRAPTTTPPTRASSTWSSWTEDGSFDSLADLAGSDDVETAPLELEGADEALVVDTTTDTLGATSVLASDGDAAYTVYPTGLTRDDELRVGTAVLRLAPRRRARPRRHGRPGPGAAPLRPGHAGRGDARRWARQ